MKKGINSFIPNDIDIAIDIAIDIDIATLLLIIPLEYIVCHKQKEQWIIEKEM
ncbi:MAG: hypothetical protein GY705_24530 [Bacteroidetes bacterium]|nr:hypothetical protein [Bacteroidota bacterium]